MKNIICVFIVLFSLTVSFGQDTIKNYPGIPIITYGYGMWNYPALQYVYMQEAGIFALQSSNLTNTDFQSKILNQNLDLFLLPEQQDNNLNNYIVKYTEARYTVFEAEGTPWENGVTLYSNDTLNLFVGNGSVSTTPLTEHGTMIYGPMYRQCRNYTAVDPDSIIYRASYRIKIEDINPWLESSPNDTVCILQVTSTKTWQWELVNGVYVQVFGGFYDTIVHAETLLTYNDLQSVGQWKDINLEYWFPHDISTWFRPDVKPFNLVGRPYVASNDDMTAKISQNCVEFKVLWKGKADRVKLSVDKITISDGRGRDLKNGVATSNIIRQLTEGQEDFGDHLAGWIGLDEPWSLDMWEPIRMVSEIMENHPSKQKLFFQFNVGHRGRFGHWQDPARANQVNMIDEFMKRVGKANVWITGWLYDVPCNPLFSQPPCDQGDFRITNLDWLADSIYKKILDAGRTYPDLLYGMSIQTGQYEIYDSIGNEITGIREINRIEFLYQANLALMYGSKLLSPWLYFGFSGTDTVTGWSYDYTGFRNSQDEPQYKITDKYLTLRDTISPRLSGLMGKTLKKLKPLEQYAGSNGINALVHPENSVPHNFIGFINALGGMADICFVELGFFEEPQFPDKHYFMPLNRYYSTLHNLRFGLINLTEYKNWKITDYVDTTHFTLVTNNGAAEFYESIYPGDAKLYSIAPVVKYGGDLIANETAGEGMTLYDDMVISNGAKLSIVGNYYAKGNIIIENGIIENLEGGQIVFQDGKKLIVNGIATISGTSEEKLTLDFISSNYENGIVIEEGTLHLSYCKIKNASNGVIAQPGSGYISIQHSEFINCSSAGIILLGSSTEGPQAPPPHNSL